MLRHIENEVSIYGLFFNMSMKTETRISKYLARAGLASRRDAEKLIVAGRVSINGLATKNSWDCMKEGDTIMLDGVKVKAQIKDQIFLFNKPKGCLSTSRDQRGRKTIFDLIKTPQDHLMIIGRLDYDSEGLILLTNNGNLKRHLELPKNGFRRFYRVKINSPLDESLLKEIQQGITIDSIRYRPMKIEVKSEMSSGVWLDICLNEGKNREIRRIFNYHNREVKRLIRVGFGPFALKNLGVGKLKKLSLANYEQLGYFK